MTEDSLWGWCYLMFINDLESRMSHRGSKLPDNTRLFKAVKQLVMLGLPNPVWKIYGDLEDA